MRGLRVCYRSFLTAVCFAGFGVGAVVLGVFVLPLVALFERGGVRKSANTVSTSWRFFVRVLEGVGLIKVEYRNVDSGVRGMVIAANHPTLIDIVLMLAKYPNSVCVAKAGVFKNPLLRTVAERICIAPDDDFDLLEKAKKSIEAGLNVIIFPEGTRSDNPKRRVNRGAAQIAIRAACPVLPVRIECIPPILGKTMPWYYTSDRLVDIRITQLEPVKCSDFENKGNFRLSKALTCEISKLLQID